VFHGATVVAVVVVVVVVVVVIAVGNGITSTYATTFVIHLH